MHASGIGERQVYDVVSAPARTDGTSSAIARSGASRA
jgi:hypothetical protein